MSPLPIAIQAYRARLDRTFDLTASIGDLELQANMTRHLCVLTSGFLEVAVTEVLAEYATMRANPLVQRYVRKNLDQFQNPKLQKIVDLVSRFDPAWGMVFSQRVTAQQKDAVDSIVANRHLIAHGRQVGISLGNMREYYRGATQVVEVLAAVCR